MIAMEIIYPTANQLFDAESKYKKAFSLSTIFQNELKFKGFKQFLVVKRFVQITTFLVFIFKSSFCFIEFFKIGLLIIFQSLVSGIETEN
jgi:hypothetical protein